MGKLGLYITVINDLYMASEKKQSESVPMNKLNEVANENYKKLSDEFAKSMQSTYRQFQVYSKNIWNQLRSLTREISLQKEYFSNSQSYYKVLGLQLQIQRI